MMKRDFAEFIRNPLAAFPVAAFISTAERQFVDQILLPPNHGSDLVIVGVGSSIILTISGYAGAVIYAMAPGMKDSLHPYFKKGSMWPIYLAAFLYMNGNGIGMGISREITHRTHGFNWEDNNYNPKIPAETRMSQSLHISRNG